ncbi:hypothetical protein J4D97_20535 [Hymenobacter defluvii]|uniref:Uncharacterized protein n=2 Tax=Hymenobacter defluvii TaxID=2054411 RepID=A0ABS3THB3_9BACT|nr:hypothetical protein [Hymenobacter defluvii]
MTHKKKWLLFAPAGLLVVGFGSCLIQWASKMKDDEAPTAQWVGAGTLALGVFNAGLSLLGRGIMENALYEIREKGPSAVTVDSIAPAMFVE